MTILELSWLSSTYIVWSSGVPNTGFHSSPLVPNLLGILAGHLYYFLTVLHPLAGGKNILRTPNWVHKLATRCGITYRPTGEAVRPDRTTGGVFSGRGRRLTD
ncbi:hypothetical protein ACHQM5_028846 [Ranunculus cassubicifolius]